MWLVITAMRRPITIVVAMVAIGLVSVIAIQRMKVDIFPQLGAPAIYVAQPYGGMDPAQMEGYLTYYYEYHFLYITGIEHVESKNIQGIALMKLVFHPETDMSQAMAEVVGYVNRARAFMPTWRRTAIHHAVRRRQRAGGAAGLFERHADAGRDAGRRVEPGAADFCDSARRLCPSAIWGQPAHDRRPRGSRAAAPVRPLPRGSGHGGQSLEYRWFHLEMFERVT